MKKQQVNLKFKRLAFIPKDKIIFGMLMKEYVDNAYIYDIPLDDFIHNRGAVFAMAIKTKFDNQNYPTIFYDSNMDKIPENAKSFLLQHELGHIQNKDLDRSSKYIFLAFLGRSFGIIPKMEYKADEYAAKSIGYKNSIDAINFLINRTNLPLITKLELRRRKKNLIKIFG